MFGVEANNIAIHYQAVIRSFYQRKQARTYPLVAPKAGPISWRAPGITACGTRCRSISTMDKALALVQQLREQPNCAMVNPRPRHWDIFSRLCKRPST